MISRVEEAKNDDIVAINQEVNNEIYQDHHMLVENPVNDLLNGKCYNLNSVKSNLNIIILIAMKRGRKQKMLTGTI